jgi:hypothetical protein
MRKDTFAYPCASNQYTWSLAQAWINPKDEAREGESHQLGLGDCVWVGPQHEKAAVVCARVYFAGDHKYAQVVDWTKTVENESDFANLKKGPLLTR